MLKKEINRVQMLLKIILYGVVTQHDQKFSDLMK